MPHASRPYKNYLGPQYWGLWGALALGKLIGFMPLRLQQILGAGIGTLLFYVLKRRRDVTLTNLKICFPELSEEARTTLARDSFRSNAMGLIEALRGWSKPPKTLSNRVTIHGLENLEHALSFENGVILYGGHFSTLDIAGSLTTLFFEADVVQRAHKNPLFNTFIYESRNRLYGKVIDKFDLRTMLKRLRQNKVIWYATDQDPGRQNTLFAPFFGHPTATLKTTMKLAGKTGTKVIPFSHFRRPQGQGFDLYLHPALDTFPSEDAHSDASRLNAFLEQEIRIAPEQYLWMHRRFKTTEDPSTPSPYRYLKTGKP